MLWARTGSGRRGPGSQLRTVDSDRSSFVDGRFVTTAGQPTIRPFDHIVFEHQKLVIGFGILGQKPCGTATWSTRRCRCGIDHRGRRGHHMRLQLVGPLPAHELDCTAYRLRGCQRARLLPRPLDSFLDVSSFKFVYFIIGPLFKTQNQFKPIVWQVFLFH